MERKSTLYKRHRFPPAIIQYAVWLYYRFTLSHRDIEDILARRGIVVTHESTRLRCNMFGSTVRASTAAPASGLRRHLLH